MAREAMTVDWLRARNKELSPASAPGRWRFFHKHRPLRADDRSE
jgi:hypothetical protein